jgi:oligopeptide transport system permease protein
MSGQTEIQTLLATERDPFKKELTYWGDVKQRFFRNKLSVAGLIVFLFLVFVAIFGPFIWKGDYRSARSGFENKRLFTSKAVLQAACMTANGFEPPKVGAPPRTDDEAKSFVEVTKSCRARYSAFLGTDDLGRDILRRVVRGLGISLRLAAAVTVAVTLLGMILGGLAGYFGGWIDNVLGRLIDALYAVPYVIIGIAFIAIFGRSEWTIIGVLIFTGWLSTARLFRAAVLQVRGQDFIEAARATGAGSRRIILQHVLPNALPPVVVSIAFSIAGAILSESIYSFLAIGFIEPTPALGVMISKSRGLFQSYPHQLLVPASVLVLLTLSIVFVGDGLRDALDPKLRGAE